MVLNDFRKDANRIKVESGKSFIELSEELGITRGALSIRLGASNIITKGYVEIIEALGYDIKVEYIKRND